MSSRLIKLTAVSLLTGQVISHLLLKSWYRTIYAGLIEQKMLELAEDDNVMSVSYDCERNDFKVVFKQEPINEEDRSAFLRRTNMVLSRVE